VTRDLGVMTSDSISPIGKMRVGGIVVIATEIRDSIDWYSRVLDFRLVAENTVTTEDDGELTEIKQAFLEGLGVALEIMSSSRTKRLDWPVPPRHLYTATIKAIIFKTDDVAETTRSLRTREANFIWSNHMLPDGNSCSLITDPDGNLIEVLGPPGTPRSEETFIHKGSSEYPPKKAMSPPRLGDTT
jgi:glyoxylase I family protein